MADKVDLAEVGRLGCDLEYAFVDLKGKFRPAGILPINGKKGHPDQYPTGGVEVDCCAVELTFPPAESEQDFEEKIMKHLSFVKGMFIKQGILVAKPSVYFEPGVLRGTRYAMEMGCVPDMNVWTGMENPPPDSNTPLRSYGGHLHIEFGNEATIKACDLTLGMWSLIHDTDNERRKLYGKAGAYRKKDYGVEYRVLSNFWCDRAYFIKQVWKLTRLAKKLASEVDDIVETVGGPDFIQDVINNNHKNTARDIFLTVTQGAG